MVKSGRLLVWFSNFFCLLLLAAPLAAGHDSHQHQHRAAGPGRERESSQRHEDEARILRQLTTHLAGLNVRAGRGSASERGAAVSEMRQIAGMRREALSDLIATNPAEVLAVAIPEAIRSGMPQEVQELVEEAVELDGTLEVTYADYEDHCEIHYTLVSGKKKFSLHFAGELPAGFETGASVRARGVRVDGAIAMAADGLEMRLADRRELATVQPNTFGDQKVLVILVNFQDKQTEPYSHSQVQNLVFGTANNFYREVSYGQTSISGTVVGWYTLPINSTCETSQIATYAKQAATAGGTNVSAYNRLMYVFPGVSCGWTGWGTYGGNPSQSWINGSLVLRTVAHELAHNFGLYHSRALDCGAEVVGGSCTTIEYGDIIDILGQSGKTGHMHAYQKERLGWLDYGISPPITTVQSSGTYFLESYGISGSNPKALKIYKGTDSSGRKEYYYVEMRRPFGFDGLVSSNGSIMNGVMVHVGNDVVRAENYLLDMTPETSSWSDAALAVGATYTDAVAGVSITPLSVGDSGGFVSVSVTPTPCVRANPAVTVSPAQSQWAPAGSAASYTVSVQNKDGNGCPASTFAMAAAVPSGWSALFSASSLTADPGATKSTTLQVTSTVSAADGFYPIQISAANSGNSAYRSTATATQVIASMMSVTVTPDKTAYSSNEWITITARLEAGGKPAVGASTSFNLKKPDGTSATHKATSDSNGVAQYRFRPKKQDPAGAWQVDVSATSNGLTGNGKASFTLNK